MKRVLLTSHKFFPEHRAGTEVLTLKIAQELQRRGYAVKVVSACPPDLDARRKEEHEQQGDSYQYDYEGVPVHIVSEALRLRDYEFSYEYYHPLIKSHFSGVIADFKPDLVQIVHAQNLSASIIEAAQAQSVPVVFYSTDFWFVCPIVQLKRPDGQVCRGPGPLALKCLDCYTPKLLPPAKEVMQAIEGRYPALAGALSGSPAIVYDSAAFCLSTAFNALKAPPAVAATLERPSVLRRLANQLDAIFVPTGLMRDIFVENGIKKDLIEKVGFGIDTSKLVNHRQKKPSQVLRIGFVGTFFEHKGVDLLLKAFLALSVAPVKDEKQLQIKPGEIYPEQFAGAELKLYGDPGQFPEYFAKLKEIVDKGGPMAEHVHFLGTFPNDKLGEIFEEIDVLVVPSRWYENTPLVMQSALATATPLIVTDLGGMAELVQEGVNGLLFKLNDFKHLSKQLAELLKSPAKLKQFAANIKPERTVGDMVDDIESIYAKVLAKRLK